MTTLAVGVIVSKPNSCTLRRGDASARTIPFHCVVSANYRAPSRFPLLQTPCVDDLKLKQASCACKTMHWFKHALDLYDKVQFFAKVEDDSIVHYDALLHVLTRLHGADRIWMSLFQWCAQEQATFRGKVCSPGGALSGRCRYPQATVTTGFASGGFDLRSRALVQLGNGCESTDFSNFGSCDGGHGVHLAKCLYARDEDVVLHDFGWRNWRHSPSPDALVVHNVKRQSKTMRWTSNMTKLPIVRRAFVQRSDDGSLVLRMVAR